MAKARTSKKEVRYRIMSDGNHKYYVPESQESAFAEWQEWIDNYQDGNYDGPDFDKNRIDGYFTFTDPKCE